MITRLECVTEKYLRKQNGKISRNGMLRSVSHAYDDGTLCAVTNRELFLPSQRVNVDQSPLPFVLNSKKTGEFIEKGDKDHNTWIS